MEIKNKEDFIQNRTMDEINKHKTIIKAVLEGNGVHYSIKEILSAHIIKNDEEHKEIFVRLPKYATQTFVWKLFGVLFSLFGFVIVVILRK